MYVMHVVLSVFVFNKRVIVRLSNVNQLVVKL